MPCVASIYIKLSTNHSEIQKMLSNPCGGNRYLSFERSFLWLSTQFVILPMEKLYLMGMPLIIYIIYMSLGVSCFLNLLNTFWVFSDDLQIANSHYLKTLGMVLLYLEMFILLFPFAFGIGYVLYICYSISVFIKGFCARKTSRSFKGNPQNFSFALSVRKQERHFSLKNGCCFHCSPLLQFACYCLLAFSCKYRNYSNHCFRWLFSFLIYKINQKKRTFLSSTFNFK